MAARSLDTFADLPEIGQKDAAEKIYQEYVVGLRNCVGTAAGLCGDDWVTISIRNKLLVGQETKRQHMKIFCLVKLFMMSI